MTPRLAIVLSSWAVAAASMVVVAPNLEGPPGALITLPVLVTSWAYGLRGALWAAAISLPTSVLSIGVATGDFLGLITSPAVLGGHALTALIGVVLGYSKSLRDRLVAETERRAAAERDKQAMEMEARLLRTDRLATLGTLAVGVAHEVNNPLTYMLGNLELAMGEVQGMPGSDRTSVDAVLENLRQVEHGAGRIEQLVRDLLLFGREQADRSGVVDLGEVVRRAARLGQHELSPRASFELEVDDTPPITGDEAKLEQVVLNLIINACHAVEERDDGVIRVASTEGADGSVVVTVEDNGAGIPEDVQARMFEPFFTTKTAGVGTGLGLAICASIVAKHGGEITVSSTLGRGTSVALAFPRAVSAA